MGYLYKILLINLASIYLILTQIVASVPKKSDHLAQIQALEREKSDLYLQLNDAIDESVKNLKETNDSDAQNGIKYALDLKEQIKKLNSTFDDNDTKEKDGRRRLGEHFKLSEEFLDKLFRDKDKSKKKMQLFQNREAMEKRVSDWLAQRLAEKQKIALYKNALSKKFAAPEVCPRYGKKGKKKKGGKSKYSGRRPCCRKCCKNSYLGCLKK